MKRSLLFLVVCGLLATHTIAWAADFPSKPIQIFVHTKPGGAVDLMARQLAQVAANYCDQPLVVINKPGGSGLLALADVYKSKPDGYTLLAFPAAFLAPLQTTDIGFGLESFHYIACMTISPEVIVTNKNSDIVTLEQILADARARPGEQKWCGPGSGTLDHLVGVEIWDKADISVKWIPYGGGAPSIVSVMGQHSDVYIGNPEDLLGRENTLTIAAVASEERLPDFPDAPTFTEFGIDMTDDVMWRGFAVKEGTPPEVVGYLEDLLWKCSQDPLWLGFVEKTMVQGVFLRNEEFTEMVNRDAESAREYLGRAGFKVGTVPESAPYPVLIFAAVLVVVFAVLVLLVRKTRTHLNGTMGIAATGLALAFLFFFMSLYFPAPRKGTFVGAATVPQFWTLFLAAMAVTILVLTLRAAPEEDKASGRTRLVVQMIVLVTAYTLLLPWIGFFPATLILLVGGMVILGYRKIGVISVASVAVLAFMYGVFYKVLMVPLPMGSLF
jgi:tripartite-type tricarboxylate transporter receptor subunit TctC